MKGLYSDYLEVNKNFQTSINLELDLYNEQKVNEYIPTTDICDVIKRYAKSILGKNKDKSTLLVGPYGKGKSFLLLVLTYLFSKNKNTECWVNLVNKIKKIDSELYDLLMEAKEKDVSLLTVVVNSYYDNIVQAFQVALHETLKREGIEDVIPKNAYDVCIELLDKWIKDSNINEAIFDKCMQVNKVDLNKLREGLVQYSPDSYKQFENLYNCVNIGLEFNPLVNNEIAKIYAETSSQIGKYGYNGIFIIFDEFSKFLENNSVNLAQDLKTIQDMAEQCSRSGKEAQLHLCCVTHKAISLYRSDRKQASNVDSFKTVEGRFKEVKFNRSIEENYQIISGSLIKLDKYQDLVDSALKEKEHFLTKLADINIVDPSIFSECYPINPITLYFLIQISELYAQNERTLFTFISDTDDNSFNSFIHTNSSGMFNADKIYDYFSGVFRNEETNSARNIWFRCESILSKLEDPDERRIIKALAVILLINDFERIPPRNAMLALALDMEEEVVERCVASLVNNGFIRRNILNNSLSFALSNTKQIDEGFKVYYQTKFDKDRIGNTLDVVSFKPYTLPRKYNEQNKITRFYKNSFITDKDFCNISNFNYYFEENYCDGVIVHLIKTDSTSDQIERKVKTINDKRLIVKYPKEAITQDFYNAIALYECLLDLGKQKGLDDISTNEIELLKEECLDDIRNLIAKNYDANFEFYSVLKEKNMSYSDLLSETMSDCYSVKLVFNNELVNKKNVTFQYQKAVNHVIDWVLSNSDEFAHSPTSPEASIRAAVLDETNFDDETRTNFRQIVDEIKLAITDNSGKKITIPSIISKYQRMPYGIRDGVMPIILAKAISELPDNVVLYFSNREIDLSAENLVKSINNEKYQVKFSKGSKEQVSYLNDMMKLFSVTSTNNFRKDVSNLASGIRRYFIGLPQIIRSMRPTNNYLELSQEFMNLKTLYMSATVNPFESIFEETKKIFGCPYKELCERITLVKMVPEMSLAQYKADIIVGTKNIFSIVPNESLKSGFDSYLLSRLGANTAPILNQSDKEIYNVIKNSLTYDDQEAINIISRAITNLYIDDWDRNDKERIYDALKSFKESIDSCQTINSEEDIITQLNATKAEISPTGDLLKNNLQGVLDDYGESINIDEKIAVLLDILKKYL